MVRKYGGYVGALVLAAIFALRAPNALAITKCPSGGTPQSGSTVNGGLEVDGVCILHNVTVLGGINIDPGAGLGFEGGTVDGGIVVGTGGELDLDAVLGFLNGDPADSGFPTGTHSTINGGITLNSPVDFDIWNSRINGDFTVNGFNSSTTNNTPSMCANVVRGGVTLSNVTSPNGVFIGDPDFLTKCSGNSIQGTVSVSNSSVVELESNSVLGSLLLDASSLEVNGNTIMGSLSCSNGATILPPEAPDKGGNSLAGSNNC